uniref:Alpha-macroglobulin receptor-binding domain-containing protein n=1 Tax=Anopheles culicifacies TaxID=139723 RepID=A0A182MFS7_9DIPT
MESRFFCFDKYTNQTFNISLDINKKADIGSKKIEFRLTPNLLTSVVDNLDNLLVVPAASGEQNMVRIVPNIVVLDYLHAIGSKEQKLFDKAKDLLLQGYQNQMRYRQSDGSFGVWHNGDGSVFITALVARSMQTASKYISEVDPAMVEKAYGWLAARQLSSGRFDEVGSVIHQELQGGLRNGISLTSYVLTSLLENEKAKKTHADVINKALSYLSSQLESINNPYDLAIATYALMLNGHSMKDNALKKLIDKSTKIEIRYGGTSVVVYYNSMGVERNCFTVTAYRRFKVAMRRPAYVVVYDNVVQEWNALQLYKVDDEDVCTICKTEDCRNNCRGE